jgi:hypothetical protein
MKKETKLYNVLFPLWMLVWFPITWIVVIPANFLIDSLVLLIACKCMKLADIKIIYKRSILQVWLFGFLADFIGSLIMFMSQFLFTGENKWLYDTFYYGVTYNPFSGILPFLYVLIATAVAGFFIYFFNYTVSFRKLDIEVKQKKKLALVMAIVTAPYLFFFPSGLFYR